MTPHPFQRAVEARDFEALGATVTDEVAFYAPIRFAPFQGRDQALGALYLAANALAFQPGFRYTTTFRDGQQLALFFEAELNGKALEGVDLLQLDEDEQVSELRVMMRPYSTSSPTADSSRGPLTRVTAGSTSSRSLQPASRRSRRRRTWRR